jgi:hypothetical protein
MTLLLTLLVSAPALADEAYTFIVKKQEAKAASRWSLSEWLDTRDRMRMMDLWLAMHSPSPYEFFIGGAYQLGTQSTGTTYSAPSFSAAAYAQIFGLGFERESGLSTRYDTTFHLRFFGYHYQATHMRAEVGIRHESVGSNLSFQNAIAGFGLTIYMAKPFGVEARWRHAFASTPNSSGLDFSGNRYEGGAFLDFSFVRVYGQYVYESMSADPSDLAADTVNSGPQAGMKLFF